MCGHLSTGATAGERAQTLFQEGRETQPGEASGAYRRHKHIIWDSVQQTNGDADGCGKSVALAFIWLEDKLWDSAMVEQRVKSLLERVAEKLGKS